MWYYNLCTMVIVRYRTGSGQAGFLAVYAIIYERHGAFLVRQLMPIALDILRLCVWFLLLAAVFVPLEKLWGVRPGRFFRKAFGTDLAYCFLSGFAPRILLVIPLSLLARTLHHFVPGAYYESVGTLPVWLRLTLGLIVGEMGGYWGHRWSHQIPFLWRFHSIHHSAEEVDWLVNTHAHPFDVAFVRLCGLIPAYALGLAQPSATGADPVPALLVVFGTAWGFLIHANINWRFGWLEWFISTPAFHHWHHTNDGPEVIDKNFAAMLPWIDKCFGTLYLPKAWPVTYGVTEATPDGFVSQIVDPLVARRASESQA